jgi:hypothetical protein
LKNDDAFFSPMFSVRILGRSDVNLEFYRGTPPSAIRPEKEDEKEGFEVGGRIFLVQYILLKSGGA